MENDSDLLPIEAKPRIQAPKSWRRYIETVSIIVALFGGGFGSGYVYCSRVMEVDHMAELDRLHQAWGGRLAGLTVRVESASAKATNAAEVAKEAAQAVKDGEKK